MILAYATIRCSFPSLCCVDCVVLDKATSKGEALTILDTINEYILFKKTRSPKGPVGDLGESVLLDIWGCLNSRNSDDR